MRNGVIEKILKILSISLSFVIIYIPVVIILLMSFTNSYSLSSLGFDNGLTLKWYASLFSNDYSSLNIATRYVFTIAVFKLEILDTYLVAIFNDE